MSSIDFDSMPNSGDKVTRRSFGKLFGFDDYVNRINTVLYTFIDVFLYLSVYSVYY